MLGISLRELGDAIVVDCSGRIVYGDEAAALRHQVKHLLGQYPGVVLNLGDVTYIDSSGLGTLVGLWASAHNSGIELKLAGVHPRVADVLKITRLATLFPMFDRAEDAAATIKKAA